MLSVVSIGSEAETSLSLDQHRSEVLHQSKSSSAHRLDGEVDCKRDLPRGALSEGSPLATMLIQSERRTEVLPLLMMAIRSTN